MSCDVVVRVHKPRIAQRQVGPSARPVRQVSGRRICGARLSSGPIFNQQSYKELVVKMSKIDLKKFMQELKKDLKQVDSGLTLEIKNL